MNIHNKLKEIGFKKCGYYRPEYSKEDGWQMVRDDIQTITKYKDGKFIKLVEFKTHRKTNSVYKFNYTRSIRFWAFIYHNLLRDIIIENFEEDPKSNKRILTINISIDQIKSKADIINLLPKELRRDYQLKQLLK
jgi:hypothetical protein